MSAAQQYFNQEHQLVRDSFSRFVAREILPLTHQLLYESAGNSIRNTSSGSSR